MSQLDQQSGAGSAEAHAAPPAIPLDQALTQRLPAPPPTASPPSLIPLHERPETMDTAPALAAPPPANIMIGDEATDIARLPTERMLALPAPHRPTRWHRSHRRYPLAVALLASLLIALVIAIPLPRLLEQRLAPPTLPSVSGVVGPDSTMAPGAHGFDWVSQANATARLRYVNTLISQMSLEDEIGQMLMIEFQEAQMTDGLAYEISNYRVGSVILYSYNMVNASQTVALDQALQAKATMPLLISTDQEGGSVNRLATIRGVAPTAAELGAGSSNAARTQGAQDAQALYKLGINTNLAPVVDVNMGGFLGDRMFASTAGGVTTYAGAYLAGLQASQQVVGCLKHFPGLGAVGKDPHQELTTFDRGLPALQQIDWAPYTALIAAGQVGMVMVTHVVLPAIDADRPASLSEPVITGVLREQMHFNGVVVTDGIYMKALAAHYTFDQIVLYAVEAGVDIISSTYSLASTDQAFRVIYDAVHTGTLSRAHIDDSVRRILLLKLQYGVLSMPGAHS